MTISAHLEPTHSLKGKRTGYIETSRISLYEKKDCDVPADVKCLPEPPCLLLEVIDEENGRYKGMPEGVVAMKPVAWVKVNAEQVKFFKQCQEALPERLRM